MSSLLQRAKSRASGSVSRISVDPNRVTPPHAVKYPEKFQALAASMREHGWRGRPLVIYRIPHVEKPYSLTGSHRIAAARKARLTGVPAYVLDIALLTRKGWVFHRDAQIETPKYGYIRDDEELAIALAEDGAPQEIVSLLLTELEKNQEIA